MHALGSSDGVFTGTMLVIVPSAIGMAIAALWGWASHLAGLDAAHALGSVDGGGLGGGVFQRNSNE